MRVVEVGPTFGLDQLRVVERPTPRPGRGQVLLRVSAAALNYRDLLMVRGLYNPRQPLPLVPCSDGVGEVVETGDAAERFAVGDRAIPIFAQDWLDGLPWPDLLRSTLGGPLDGTLAELMVLDQRGLVPAPESLTDEECATLPCAGVTAWNAIAPLEAGGTVLVEGTGGVALFALQLARARGARVIVTSSSDRKLERARELGAWETINYRDTPEWGKLARQLTGGAGVDLVVEVGGARTLPQALAAVAVGGQISLLGNLSGRTLELDLVPLFMRQIRLQGLVVGSRASFEELVRALERHAVRPVIDRVFPMSNVREAMERMESATHFGKLCVRI
ncbi:MAG TPA: NAD(P)-dependent alcohol dehydrogenase [Candidatus Polarisedimenticolaceae bacterium]|nr:NAD(P)-dependent alcohol dehydrogenase [Candidatus Polarisedimenticolaceae bacterium]